MILAMRRTMQPEPIDKEQGVTYVLVKCSICNAECAFSKEAYKISLTTRQDTTVICDGCFELDPLSIITKMERT